MKITKVAYTALANLGNYENEKIELEATLEDGDKWEEVLENLKTKVHSELKNELDYRRYCNEFYMAQRKLRDIEEKIKKAEVTWDTVSTFMVAQGIKTDPAKFPAVAALPSAKEDIEEAEVI